VNKNQEWSSVLLQGVECIGSVLQLR